MDPCASSASSKRKRDRRITISLRVPKGRNRANNSNEKSISLSLFPLGWRWLILMTFLCSPLRSAVFRNSVQSLFLSRSLSDFFYCSLFSLLHSLSLPRARVCIDTEVWYKTIVGDIASFTLTVYFKKINKTTSRNIGISRLSLKTSTRREPKNKVCT